MFKIFILESNNYKVINELEVILKEDFAIPYCANNIFTRIVDNNIIEQERLDLILNLNKGDVKVVVIDKASGESILKEKGIDYIKLKSNPSIDILAEDIILC